LSCAFSEGLSCYAGRRLGANRWAERKIFSGEGIEVLQGKASIVRCGPYLFGNDLCRFLAYAVERAARSVNPDRCMQVTVYCPNEHRFPCIDLDRTFQF